MAGVMVVVASASVERRESRTDQVGLERMVCAVEGDESARRWGARARRERPLQSASRQLGQIDMINCGERGVSCGYVLMAKEYTIMTRLGEMLELEVI